MPTVNGKGEAFSSLFDAQDIICQTEIKDRDTLILELLKLLAFNHGIGNVPTVMEAVLERENAQATVLANGIAVPHARIENLHRPYVSIATTQEGVVFSGDYAPIHVVILVLVPKDKPAYYLQILSSIAQICKEDRTASDIARLSRREDVYDYLKGNGIALPEHVCAGDIMCPDPAALQENDNLKNAIDLFVERDLVDIPVVDRDGDLVGIVAATALMRVCLPDYLLWMDDLSPIINFEPFVSVLRNESNTWLAEIMSHDYAVVQADDPAITVAEEMTRRNVNRCYVVRGKKLVGVITLQHFLNKVLRE